MFCRGFDSLLPSPLSPAARGLPGSSQGWPPGPRREHGPDGSVLIWAETWGLDGVGGAEVWDRSPKTLAQQFIVCVTSHTSLHLPEPLSALLWMGKMGPDLGPALRIRGHVCHTPGAYKDFLSLSSGCCHCQDAS